MLEIPDLKNKIVSLSTVTKDNKPHSIACEINGIKDKKIIITDNYMKTTIDNIKDNAHVCIVYWDNQTGYRICGTAKYYECGEWLKFVESLPENKNFPCKGALIVNVENVVKLG